jgi:hypothetical protein
MRGLRAKSVPRQVAENSRDRGGGIEGRNPLGLHLTEYSVSVSTLAPPQVRYLAEVVRGDDPGQLNRRRVLDAVTQGLALLGDRFGEQHDTTLFRQVFGLIYGRPGEGKERLRFGTYIECAKDRPPILKCYFDLHAASTHQALEKLALVARIIGVDVQWSAFVRICDNSKVLEACRIVGVDFRAQHDVAFKAYLAGRFFSINRLQRLLTRLGKPEGNALLRKINALLLGRIDPDEPLSCAMVGLRFVPGQSMERLGIGLDVYLPALYPDDEKVHHALTGLSKALSLDCQVYSSSLEVMAKGRPLRDTTCIQQYAGIDVGNARYRRLSVYMRPMEIDYGHMSESTRPRMR